MTRHRRAPVTRIAITLPADFRSDEALAFHGRDPQALSERAGPEGIAKAVLLDGQAVCLTVRIGANVAEAELVAASARNPRTPDASATRALVHRLLGLAQPVATFEHRFADHPELGRLLRRRPGLRVPLAATPFEALAWAITGQQISVQAAVGIRRRLIERFGTPHPDGLVCHPVASQIAALGVEDLRAVGYSRAKAEALLSVSQAASTGDLALDGWDEPPQPPQPPQPVALTHTAATTPEPPSDARAETVRAALARIRGIGPWTIDYTLLRGFGWLDGSLHGDVAVRRALRVLLGIDEIDAAQTRDWLAPFSPWRALVAAHLWASLGDQGY